MSMTDFEKLLLECKFETPESKYPFRYIDPVNKHISQMDDTSLREHEIRNREKKAAHEPKAKKTCA